MNKIIIIFLGIVFIDGILKRKNMFDYFIEGVKEALSLFKPLFTTLVAFMLFVTCMRNSGFIDILGKLLAPVLDIFQIPVDIAVLSLLRPVSANASLSFLYSIYEFFGIDHPVSLLGTLIQSGSDTTLYVVSLYYGSIHLKKYSYTLWLGFFLDFLSFVFILCFYYLGMIS